MPSCPRDGPRSHMKTDSRQSQVRPPQKQAYNEELTSSRNPGRVLKPRSSSKHSELLPNTIKLHCRKQIQTHATNRLSAIKVPILVHIKRIHCRHIRPTLTNSNSTGPTEAITHVPDPELKVATFLEIYRTPKAINFHRTHRSHRTTTCARRLLCQDSPLILDRISELVPQYHPRIDIKVFASAV